MKHTITRKETEAIITITLAWDDLKGDFEKAVTVKAGSASPKGFRKGHVPKDVAEKTVNRAQILSEVVDGALRHAYHSVMEKEALKLAGAPEVSIKKLAEGNDVIVEITAALYPDIALPKGWKKMVDKVNKEQTDVDQNVADKDIDAEVQKLAESRTEHVPVERAAAKDDHVKVDFVVKQDGVIIEGGTSKDHSLVLGKGVFIPGFEEEVIGMEKDTEKTFDLTFPKEYHAKHLAGKPATFDVTLKSVEERKMPEISDAFAVSLGQDFKTLEDLKKSLKDNLVSEKQKQAEEIGRTAILDVLTDALDVKLPEIIIASELTRMMGEMEQQISASGMNFDEYLKGMNKTREELSTSWKPQAEKRVKSALILEAIGEELEINPEKEEVEAEMNKMLAMYKDVPDFDKNIDMRELYDYHQGILRNQKVFAELVKM